MILSIQIKLYLFVFIFLSSYYFQKSIQKINQTSIRQSVTASYQSSHSTIPFNSQISIKSQIMQDLTKQSLLAWLSKTLHQQINLPQNLRNGQYLLQLSNKIPGINIKIENKYEGWKDSYLRLKSIYQQLQGFMKNTIKYQFPNAINTMNIVQMAKGQDDEGLMNLLYLIFLICFNIGPQNSQIFVEKAILLPQKYQQQLMDIVKNNQIPKYQAAQMQQFEQKYERQRQKVKQMISALQNLSIQNQSLRDTMLSQADDHKKISQLLKKAQQQRDKLKKQLLQNYKNKQEQQPSKNNVIVEHHQQMIQILKSNILQQEQNYSQQIFQLKEKIETLQEQLDIYKNKVNQLEESTFKGTVDHSNCMSLQNYKKQKNQITTKLTDASAKQWKTKLENIKLQNLTQQLKQKNKKLTEQCKNKENTTNCSKNQANKLKFQFFTQIRDKLKQKCQNNVMLSAQPKKKQSQDNLQKIILDDPEIN